MTSKYGPLGFRVDDCYRNVPEARIVGMLMVAGWAFEMGSAVAEEASRDALQSWIQIGLGFRCATNGERLFDAVEVYNFMKRAGLDDRHGFWAERCVSTGRRLVQDLAKVGPSGLCLDERPFAVHFKRTFNLGAILRESRMRLRMPLPIEANYLRNLRVEPFAEDSLDTEFEVSPGRLEARILARDMDHATIGAKISFTARFQEPYPDEVDEEPDQALYLRRREGLIVVSERIDALAQSLSGRDAPVLDAVRAFLNYIQKELICGTVHYDQVDAASPCDWVLDSGWFDCQLGSALLVALCRARGIPARIIGGYFLYPRAPLNHFWPEVWIEDQGWLPFDFLGWELSQNGSAEEWTERFFGRLDYRMTCECLPRKFIGSVGIPIPPVWSILPMPKPGGVGISLLDENGTPLFTDTIQVTV
jgi:Transglutaminase-like superfamily